jgi:hypothetical protein
MVKRSSTLLVNEITFILLLSIIAQGCVSSSLDEKNKNKKTAGFQFKETIVDSADAGMTSFSGFLPNKSSDLLCQHWELMDMEDASSDALMWKHHGHGDRLYQEIFFFKDSSAVQNPRNGLKFGRWDIVGEKAHKQLVLRYENGTSQVYTLSTLSSRSLLIRWRSGRDSMYMKMRADGKVHHNIVNDPFHPINLKWMIKPTHPENDSMILSRVKQCVRFYALFYRDNILRESKALNFAGLPEIFIWYNGGIGLLPRAEIDSSWIDCFYNKPDAEKGYDILRKLMVNYEFDWPEGTPGWTYRTHSVLEQMYHKL